MKLLKSLIVTMAALWGTVQAAGIDNTCATCGRRALDSLNTIIGSIRVNQVGYRTDDPHKEAFVGGGTSAQDFKIVDAAGATVHTGVLEEVGTFPYKGRIMIKGYFNSITTLYQKSNTTYLDSAAPAAAISEKIWRADFGDFATEGSGYRVVVGSDTSLPFDIRMTVYNDVFETSLKFFGWQRSGDNDSWAHGPSHMKDGSAIGHDLTGGWYDCGDYFKVGQTVAYAFTNLILGYTLWPQKAEDRYGSSYNDTLPFGTDGVPDILREAKIGADYVMRLYRASVADGKIAAADMYQDVGVWGNDHQYWDKPENADAAPVAKGGPDRPVTTAKGSAVPAQFAGSLAMFAKAWEPFDPVFADSCLKAAKDIYKRVILPNWKTPGPGTVDGFYIAQGRWDDDLAWAATGLWYATGDTTYKYDLMGNPAYGSNPGAVANPSQREFFPGGFMAMHASKLFSPGGWVMDYQNTFSHTTWALWKLFYRTDSLASTWKIPAADAQLVRERLRKLVGNRYARESTNGNGVYPGTEVNVLTPYSLVWSSVTWGMNRYNMGSLIPIVSYHEMIRDDSAAAAKAYWNIILDNMNYNLGKNPWDISFLMGAGSKNLQHPHNRISNPEGYNAGGIPYDYRSPKGALMGGAIPGQLLRDEWEKYDVTETCIDFSAQMMLPAQYLSQDLPPDVTGPRFQNVTVVKTTETTALISWQTDELSRDTLFYSLFPGGPVAGSVAVNLAKNKTATLTGLVPNTTYSFWFKGMDIYRNVSIDDNRGRYYRFVTTTTTAADPTILDIKVCNIRSDRATVFWWTDIPSSSSVEFAQDGNVFASAKKLVDGDDEGIPGRFHKVTLKGLKPGTTYRYDVLSDGVREDSNGVHHVFTTTQDFADYTVQIKATKKNGSGAGAHFYLEVANNESKPYVGLELRFYFQADAATAGSLVVHGTDNAIFDVGGLMVKSGPAIRDVKAAVAVPGIANQWYLPIVITDTLPVAGRARLELKMDDANWNAIPWSKFTGAWSLVSHTDPVAFGGVDLASPWAGPDQVEKDASGANVVTYVKDPYVAGFYKGVHIFGYPPDGTKPKVFRTTNFRFSAPVPSPATAVRQDSMGLGYAGRTWSFPDVVQASWQVDNPGLRPVTAIDGRTDSVLFALDTTAPQGGGSDEFAFWGDRDSTYCSCAWQRYTVTVDTMKVIPRQLTLAWTPVGPVSAWSGNRRQELEVSLLDSAGLLDTTVTVRLAANVGSGARFWGAASGGSQITFVTLLKGKATVWVSDETVESATLTASATLDEAIVKSANVTMVFQEAPLWPLFDSAWTMDSSCAGSPTHVVVKLSTRLSDENVVTGASLMLSGKAVEVPEDSIHVAADSMRILIGLEAGLVSGSAVTGSATLTVHAMGGGRDTTVSIQGTVLDRIGPRLLQARLLEEESPADLRDTLYLQFSEPVRLSGSPLILPAGTSTADAVAIRAADTTGRLWIVAMEPARALAVGMAVKAAAGVGDLAGNAADDCAGDVVLAQSWRPVPIASSWIRSSADDGRSDQVVVKFRRKLRSQDVPDSVGAVWGADSLRTVSSTVEWTIASDSLSMTASMTFPWGATRGSGTDGAGVLRFFAPGALVPSEAVLADSVGPILLAAKLRYGADDALDTLEMRFSEPLIAASRAGVSWNAVGQRLQGELLAGKDASRWSLLLRADSTGLRAGDSLRAQPRSAGGAQDEAGNANEHAWRWAPLTFGTRPPVFLVQPRNPLVTFAGWNFGSGSSLAALVRSGTDTNWMTVGGERVASEENSRKMGIGIVTNECIDGYVVVYDNLGTYVASIDLKDLRKACEEGLIPLDLAGRYQAWIAWDGRSFTRQTATSGVYTLRLITRRNLQSPGREKVTNQLFRFGWKRK